VATPEKALLDLIYLTPGGDRRTYLRELRLQNLDALDSQALQRLAARSGKPKLHRALRRLSEICREEEYRTL